VWAINLFNLANVTGRKTDGRGLESTVYSSTGDPSTTGWLNTAEGRQFVDRFGTLGEQKYLLAEQNPLNYDTPRQVRFGMALNF
ncbi:MAG: hypothetical protein ACO36I_20830, partial [Candidatus Latescibacterota bacterium]